VDGARIYAIRPVAADYALDEYGATAAERTAGRLTEVFPDENPANQPRRGANRSVARKRTL